MDPATPGRANDARRLRAIERGLLTTDAAWVRRTFGDVARPLRPGWLVLCCGLDALAAVLVVYGLLVALPVVFAGFLLANAAVCLHLERSSRGGS